MGEPPGRVRVIMLRRQALGNHQKSGKHTDVRRPNVSVLRALTATGAVALSIWSLNLAGSAVEREASLERRRPGSVMPRTPTRGGAHYPGWLWLLTSPSSWTNSTRP